MDVTQGEESAFPACQLLHSQAAAACGFLIAFELS